MCLAPPLPEDGNGPSFQNVVFSCILDPGQWTTSRIVLSVTHSSESSGPTLLEFLSNGSMAAECFSRHLLPRSAHCGAPFRTFEHDMCRSLILDPATFYPQKLALTSPISVGLSVCIVRPGTNATELLVIIHVLKCPSLVEVKLRPTASRPVCPGVRRPSGTCDQFFFRHDIFFRQLRLCYFVAPSLTRGRVCTVKLFLGLARAFTLEPKSRRTRSIFCCLISDSPNLEGQVPVFISPRNRVAQLYPRAVPADAV
jgi:hypothetical protein